MKPDNGSLHALLSITKDLQSSYRPNKLEYLYFALGKCYDDIGEWAKAFEYFTEGCRFKTPSVLLIILQSKSSLRISSSIALRNKPLNICKPLLTPRHYLFL